MYFMQQPELILSETVTIKRAEPARVMGCDIGIPEQRTHAGTDAEQSQRMRQFIRNCFSQGVIE